MADFYICDECGGRGFRSFRIGGDMSCSWCDGEGVIYSKRKRESEKEDD